VTNLYEAGDVNTVDGGQQRDINGTDDVNASDDINGTDDIDDGDDFDDVDDINDADEGNEGNGSDESFDGGTPLAVLNYLARSLSNDPEAVVIDTEERRGGLRLSLHVAPDDMGRVIGRRGRTAQAIRTLVNVAGAKDGVQASVDIVDD
jgi:predicted RNA-binding protein YlqC (UPF0109 family)